MSPSLPATTFSLTLRKSTTAIALTSRRCSCGNNNPPPPRPTATKWRTTLSKSSSPGYLRTKCCWWYNRTAHYESTNQLANYGDEIKEYIQQLASAVQPTQPIMPPMSRKWTNWQWWRPRSRSSLPPLHSWPPSSMMRIKIPMQAVVVAKVADTARAGAPPKKLRNMGAYCHSHRLHPVGLKHNSTKCGWKEPKHITVATWLNRLNSNMFWPTTKCVAIGQQDHPT